MFKKIRQKSKNIYRQIRYGYKASSEAYTDYLRKHGAIIGNDVIIYDPQSTNIDIQNPWMISIGNHVRITKGVNILTHDYAWCVIAGVYGEMLGAVGRVDIGDNVFIGNNTIILRNVKIGDNVIIGAGSVVSVDCESNSVYAGAPAKKRMTLDEYYNKRKAAVFTEVTCIANSFYKQTGKKPDIIALREYLPLFYGNEMYSVELEKLMRDTGYYDKCLNYLKNHDALYGSIEEFTESIRLI